VHVSHEVCGAGHDLSYVDLVGRIRRGAGPESRAAVGQADGGTTFHFVTEGFDAAYSAACQAAGNKGMDIAGGAWTVRQALIAGVIDEFTLDIAPVLLGSGERIFDGVESFGFEPVEVLHSPLTTHIRYRRVS
jgi:dihydrofolate reductase